MHFYFDHNASTPVHPRVLDRFAAAVRAEFGNASSVHHYGQNAKHTLEYARRVIAKELGATPREVVFTSGGTEANNLAILGIMRASGHRSKHLITTSIEHPAVLASCAEAQREGCEVTCLPVGVSGAADPDDLRRALRPDTVLISIMHANNETGAIQPITELASIARQAGALFHSDGVQAFGRLPVNVRELGVDLYAVSAHKRNAPKGTGALFVRDQVALSPASFGGRQERGRRAGTENVAGAAAFAEACEIATDRAETEALRDRLEAGILERVPGARVNAKSSPRLPNTSSITFPAVSGEALVIALDLAGFAVSSGAACSSGSIEPSHVLLAMGLSDAEARSSVRFSLGWGNTREQVDALVEAVARVASSSKRELQHA